MKINYISLIKTKYLYLFIIGKKSMQSEGPLLKYEKTNERIQKHVKTKPKR